MKNSVILINVFACLILGSCNKDILDKGPETNISDAYYWKSANDLKLYCNGFYNIDDNFFFPRYSNFGTKGIYSLDGSEGSDVLMGIGVNSQMNGEWIVTSNNETWAWSNLRKVNYFLDNVHRVTAIPEQINQYAGEALFFRAQFYYGMVKTYGDVPWINKALDNTSPELYNPRTPRNIVIDSVLANLDMAVSYLPTKKDAAVGRVYKELAMALQSRVALFEGTWEKYHAGTPFGVQGSNGTKYLQKAAQVSEDIINSGVFALDNVNVPNGYRSLFNQKDYASSKEVIFWRKYDLSIPITHEWHRYLAGGIGATKAQVNSYLCTDGKPIATSNLYQGDASLAVEFNNRDPRLAQSILKPGDVTESNRGGQPDLYFTVPAFTSAIENTCPSGYQLGKGFATDAAQHNTSSGVTGCIYYRYAEVLLNFAEAKAELGTITQADIDKSIKLLRERVGMPNLVLANITTDPNWLFPALSPIINEVRRERMVELFAEGFRRTDIFRWAAADELIVGKRPIGAKRSQWKSSDFVDANEYNSFLKNYPVDASGNIDYLSKFTTITKGYQFNLDRDYLSPVPESQINLNNKLTQNPGWK